MISNVPYCTRETVMAAFDVAPSVIAHAQVDRAILSATTAVNGLLHRSFVPWTGTRTFPHPNRQRAATGRLWLDASELHTATTVTADGVTIPPGAAGYYLEPVNTGPPYNLLELSRDGSAMLGGGQRGITIDGVWCGCPITEVTAGGAAEALETTTEAELQVDPGADIGVGALVRIDDERMLVTERGWLTTGQTGTLTASTAAVTLTVADGTTFAAGETLLIDSERVFVTEVAGNVLTIRRAVQGSSLAAHTTATVYALRSLTVSRGALGTAAAAHLIDAPILLYVVPPLVSQLAEAYAQTYLMQANSGWARSVGPGGGDSGAPGQDVGRGLAALEAAAYAAHGRKVRMRAV